MSPSLALACVLLNEIVRCAARQRNAKGREKEKDRERTDCICLITHVTHTALTYLWFEITMDEVLGAEEFQCGCCLDNV